MSVTIMYRPMAEGGTAFTSGTSSDLKALEDAVGLEIVPAAVPILRAMAIASKREFYDEVADTVEKIGPITVWGEY